MKPIKKGKTYYFVQREGGRQRWVSLKTTYKEEAVIRLGELLRQRHRPSFGIAKDPQDIAWEELVARFLEMKRGNGDSPRTISRTISYFNSVRRHLDIRMSSDWTIEKVEEFKKARLAIGTSPGTINKELETIRAALRRARKWGYIAPALEDLQEVKRIKDPRRPAFYFPDQDAERLLAAAKPFWRIATLLSLRAGLRRSEALHLLWSDLDFEAREIRVVSRPGALTKNRQSRVIPMDEGLVQPLFEWRARHGDCLRVLPWKNETYAGKGYFSQGFIRLLRRMGFPKEARYHSLRHTFATSLAKAGVSQLVIAALLGHLSYSVTSGYTHLNMDDLRQAIRKLPVLRIPSNLSSNVLTDIGQFRPTKGNTDQSGGGGKS